MDNCAKMKRIELVSGHFQKELVAEGSASSKIGVKSDNDPVICCALRTPLGRSKKGSFKDTPPEDLLAAVFAAIVKKTNIDPWQISDAVIGNVLAPGAAALQARVGQLMGG